METYGKTSVRSDFDFFMGASPINPISQQTSVSSIAT